MQFSCRVCLKSDVSLCFQDILTDSCWLKPFFHIQICCSLFTSKQVMVGIIIIRRGQGGGGAVEAQANFHSSLTFSLNSHMDCVKRKSCNEGKVILRKGELSQWRGLLRSFCPKAGTVQRASYFTSLLDNANIVAAHPLLF